MLLSKVPSIAIAITVAISPYIHLPIFTTNRSFPTSPPLIAPPRPVLDTPKVALSLHAQIQALALQHEIPSRLIRAVISTESSWRPHATRLEPKLLGRYPPEQATSYGLMQVMGLHTTPKGLCPTSTIEDLLTPQGNLTCGVQILARALRKYRTTKEALIAYNGGDGCLTSPACTRQATQYANKVLITQNLQ